MRDELAAVAHRGGDRQLCGGALAGAPSSFGHARDLMKPTALPRTTDQIIGEYLLDKYGVMAKCVIGETKLRELIAAGDFPQPLNDRRLGSLQRWRGSDVDAWIRELSRSLRQAS